MKDTGIVNIHGKQYQTVAYRIQQFWERHPEWSIWTEVLHRDESCVMVKSIIRDEKGTVRATGHAEEYRSSSQINKTSALENAETSSLGRALAAAGLLGGGEFASADEVAHAISGKASIEDKVHNANAKPNAGAGNELSAEVKNGLELKARAIGEAVTEWDKVDQAFKIYSEVTETAEKLYIWSLLSSKVRTAIKKYGKEKSE